MCINYLDNITEHCLACSNHQSNLSSADQLLLYSGWRVSAGWIQRTWAESVSELMSVEKLRCS